MNGQKAVGLAIISLQNSQGAAMTVLKKKRGQRLGKLDRPGKAFRKSTLQNDDSTETRPRKS